MSRSALRDVKAHHYGLVLLAALVGMIFFFDDPKPVFSQATQQTIFLTSGSSWTVPTDWNNASNTIEVIGGGGGGSAALDDVTSGGGGGGGAYAGVTNVSLVPGESVQFAVGVGGAASTTGGDTYFCTSSSNCASIVGTAVVVGAKGGGAGAIPVGGTGGSAVSSTGTTKFSGGNGGSGGSASNNAGGGGGGAAGPGGAGRNGGNGVTRGGGGGGGAGGGASTAGANGATSRGGSGGSNRFGTGGGTSGVATNMSNAACWGTGPVAGGIDGGGGAGGSRYTSGSSTQGCGRGDGGSGTEFDGTRGAGGGGGGEVGLFTGFIPFTAGIGGLYGGGGGGGGAEATTLRTRGGPGRQGIIVIRYLALPPVSCTLTPTPASIVNGNSSSLAWTSTNATSLTIDNGIGAVTPAAGGSRSVSPTVTTTYTATATGPGGTSQCQTTVTVTAPPACTPVSGGTPLTGYAWSDNVGWISLSCSNDNSCGTSTYGIQIASNGTMSGCAWNDNVGWITATAADLTSCPSGTCSARMNDLAMEGWMKALSSNDAQSGGWDGFISLSGASYGATLNATTGVLSGYAWGDMNVGWVVFNSAFHTAQTTWRPACASQYSCTNSTTRQNACTGSVPETCTSGFVCSAGSCILPAPPSAGGTNALTVTPRLVRPGGTVVVSWDVSNATTCSVTEDRTTMNDSWSGLTSATASCTQSGTGCRTSPIPGVTTYTLTCSGLGGNLTQRATVNTTPVFKEI